MFACQVLVQDPTHATEGSTKCFFACSNGNVREECLSVAEQFVTVRDSPSLEDSLGEGGLGSQLCCLIAFECGCAAGVVCASCVESIAQATWWQGVPSCLFNLSSQALRIDEGVRLLFRRGHWRNQTNIHQLERTLCQRRNWRLSLMKGSRK